VRVQQREQRIDGHRAHRKMEFQFGSPRIEP